MDMHAVNGDRGAGAVARSASTAQCHGTASGVTSNNIPPLTRKLDIFTGGEDWFEFMFYVDWNFSFPRLKEKLDRLKEIAKDEKTEANILNVDNYGILEVDRMGARLGTGGKGLYFAYKLHAYDGLTIMLSERETAHKTMPNMIFRATGEYCLEHGTYNAFISAETIIKEMGGSIVKNKLSRVDVCLDMPSISIDDFLSAFNHKRYITRSKCYALYKSNGFTLQFGSKSLQCRIYDKKAEIEAKANPRKKALMLLRQWHGRIPQHATRVEFQIRRDKLKSLGIDSVILSLFIS